MFSFHSFLQIFVHFECFYFSKACLNSQVDLMLLNDYINLDEYSFDISWTMSK